MHQRILLLLGIVLFMKLDILPVMAQVDGNAGSWDLIYYDTTQHELVTLTAEGIQDTVSLNFIDVPTIHQASLSSDGRYLAGTTDYQGRAFVADLDTQTTFFIGSGVYVVGPFSPDNQQVVFAHITGVTFPDVPEAEVFIFDVASQSTTLSLTMNNEFPVTFGQWENSEIEIGNIGCYNCDQPPLGRYDIWDLTSGSYWQSERRYGNGILPMTGERVYWDYTPVDPERMFWLQRAYYAAESGNDGVIIRMPVYQGMPFPTDSMFPPSPDWVLNGQALLDNEFLLESTQWRAFFRDGTSRTIDAPDTTRFLVGTLDGWLLYDFENDQILHYDEANDFEPIGLTSDIERFPLVVAISPPLGINIDTTFVLEPCSLLSLAPRLVIGEMARVTPGAPNNLRAEPDAESELIGEIPGEGEFLVIDGPVCTDELSWWQVDYNGAVGWTAEGGRNYWLEPLFDN